MAPILTAEDVVRRIAAECAFVDERGGVGIRQTQHLLPKSVFDRPGSDRRNLASTTFPDAGPMVRIRFPPAASQERTPPSRDRNGSGRCAQSRAPRPVPLQHRARQAQMANRLYSSVDEKRGSGHLGLIDRAEQGAPDL